MLNSDNKMGECVTMNIHASTSALINCFYLGHFVHCSYLTFFFINDKFSVDLFEVGARVKLVAFMFLV